MTGLGPYLASDREVGRSRGRIEGIRHSVSLPVEMWRETWKQGAGIFLETTRKKI